MPRRSHAAWLWFYLTIFSLAQFRLAQQLASTPDLRRPRRHKRRSIASVGIIINGLGPLNEDVLDRLPPLDIISADLPTTEIMAQIDERWQQIQPRLHLFNRHHPYIIWLAGEDPRREKLAEIEHGIGLLAKQNPAWRHATTHTRTILPN